MEYQRLVQLAIGGYVLCNLIHYTIRLFLRIRAN